jgi:hypothetical protein
MRMIDRKPVVDADKPVTLQITQADCNRGSKKDPTRCAAALALKRATGCDECRVHIACTYLRFGEKWLRYATPPSLKAEIISFDRGGGFYPGDFRLHPMPASNRLRPIRQKPGPKPKANPPPPAEVIRAAKSGTDPFLMRLQQQATTPAPKVVRAERRAKSEPRVFHRVKGVRERANKRAI